MEVKKMDLTFIPTGLGEKNPDFYTTIRIQPAGWDRCSECNKQGAGGYDWYLFLFMRTAEKRFIQSEVFCTKCGDRRIESYTVHKECETELGLDGSFDASAGAKKRADMCADKKQDEERGMNNKRIGNRPGFSHLS